MAHLDLQCGINSHILGFATCKMLGKSSTKWWWKMVMIYHGTSSKKSPKHESRHIIWSIYIYIEKGDLLSSKGCSPETTLWGFWQPVFSCYTFKSVLFPSHFNTIWKKSWFFGGVCLFLSSNQTFQIFSKPVAVVCLNAFLTWNSSGSNLQKSKSQGWNLKNSQKLRAKAPKISLRVAGVKR